MPRIDIGNFGNDVPQAVAAPDRSAIARGVQALGQAGFSVAAELQQRKEATARNTAANDLLDHELKVKTLAEQYADDLATGKRDPTEARAKFDEEAQALESKKIDFLPPEAGDALRRGRERTVFQAGAVVDRAAEGETRRRGQVQVSESIAALEAMAALPGSDVAAINKRIAELEPMATNAGIPIDRFRAASTQAQESNWMNEASLRAGQNRNNPAGLVQLAKDLTEGKYVGKFDAGRRNTILAGVESSLNNIEMRRARAEERAAREQELHLAKAGAAFNAFQALADKGTMLDPAYTDQVLAATAGTPYQASIRAQMAYAKENGGLAAQPVEQQQRVLDAIDRQIATTGRTPALDARREQVAKVLSGSQEDVKRDGLRAAFERGVIADLAPIDVSNAITLAATAGDRADQAAAASQWAGRQVSPLTEDESAKVARRVSSLQPRDRAAYLKAFTEQFGPAAMTAVAAQIASNPNDRSVAIGAYLATRSTTERRSTAEVYFTGQDALAQGTVKPDAAKETGTRAAIYKELAGVYRTQTETNVAADAAYNIWAGLKLEGRDNVKQAVALATGGVIEHQGVQW